MDFPSSPLSHARRMTLLVGLWGFVVLVLITFRSAVLPFAGAAIIAYVVAPVVDRLAGVRVGRRTLPRWGALLLVYAVFFVLAYAFFVALVPQLYKELARISRDLLSSAQGLTPARTRELASQVEVWLSDHGLPVALTSRTLDDGSGRPFNVSVDLEQVIRDFASRVSSFIEGNVVNIFRTSQVVLGGMLTSVFMVFFMLMVAAFFSIDAGRIGRYVSTLVPANFREDAEQLLSRVDRSLAGVVRGQLTICLVNGLLTLMGLLLFRVKFAFLLATIATFFSLVPIFGTIISSVPIMLVALGTGGWKSGIAMLLWILGIHALEAYFLNPKIMGQAARIHPVVVAFALLAGERTYGILGALLAAPLAAVLVACFEFVRQRAQPTTPASPG
jgi:predicted PurR-regulated permease PerM